MPKVDKDVAIRAQERLLKQTYQKHYDCAMQLRVIEGRIRQIKRNIQRLDEGRKS